MSIPMNRYFAVTAKGLEPILAKEIKELGGANIQERPGGVSFEGDQRTLYLSCLWLRTASRVLQEVRTFSARNPEMLYDQIRRMKWHELLTPEMTFAVRCTASNASSAPRRFSDESPVRRDREQYFRDRAVRDRLQPRFVALKIKDAIVDEMRKRWNGIRSNVDPENPDVWINAYLDGGKCTISLDASGGSLHERGYRRQDSGAPLKETLAAGIVLMTDWRENPEAPFVDLMSGAGTLCIEAALIGANIAPGLLRTSRFGFERWRNFDSSLWKELQHQAIGARKNIKLSIFGYDMQSHAVETARANATRASVEKQVRFYLQRVENLPSAMVPEKCGTVIANPPYGERLGENPERLRTLYKRLGDSYKHQFKGWKGFIFSGNSDATKAVGLRTSKRIPLFNGPIECRLLRYELF